MDHSENSAIYGRLGWLSRIQKDSIIADEGSACIDGKSSMGIVLGYPFFTMNVIVGGKTKRRQVLVLDDEFS